jgi:hypothetical protein
MIFCWAPGRWSEWNLTIQSVQRPSTEEVNVIFFLAKHFRLKAEFCMKAPASDQLY